jgi:hypothetical protein
MGGMYDPDLPSYRLRLLLQLVQRREVIAEILAVGTVVTSRTRHVLFFQKPKILKKAESGDNQSPLPAVARG